MQYIKIKQAIAEQMSSGRLAARQKLPSERKLAESFDTTRVTLREALSLLEAEGLIYREDRRGWFISPQRLKYDPSQTLNFSAMARAQNRVPKTEIVTAKMMLANQEAVQRLQLLPFADVINLERVRYLDERPVVYVINYIKPQFFPNLLSHDLTQSLTNIYQQQYATRYYRTEYRITTSSLVGDMAKALRATFGSPAMVVERRNYSQQDELLDCDIEYWRHDAICIESCADLQ